MTKFIAALAAALLTCASSAFATRITVDDYVTARDSARDEVMRTLHATYILGIVDGISVAMVDARGKGAPTMICGQTDINPDDALRMVDDELKMPWVAIAGPSWKEIPMAFVVGEALKRLFPCR